MEFCVDGTHGRPPPVHEHIYSNGHICLDSLYSGWSPAMTAERLCLSIQSMISSATVKVKPEGDREYSTRHRGSSKDTRWVFHDDKC